MNQELFAYELPERQSIAPGAQLLRRFALPYQTALVTALTDIAAQAPFRHMTTPGGYRMAVAMTHCGAWGWVSDARGYRYEAACPQSGRSWPCMPIPFQELAHTAAAAAGFPHYVADSCLINRYEVGTRLTLHQDKDERDPTAPIVSVSLGLPATFLFGGALRCSKTRHVPLSHGDVLVWGGPSRFNYHGVLALKPGCHPMGAQRINLTFRRAM